MQTPSEGTINEAQNVSDWHVSGALAYRKEEQSHACQWTEYYNGFERRYLTNDTDRNYNGLAAIQRKRGRTCPYVDRAYATAINDPEVTLAYHLQPRRQSQQALCDMHYTGQGRIQRGTLGAEISGKIIIKSDQFQLAIEVKIFKCLFWLFWNVVF